jgi:hypothetical protein
VFYAISSLTTVQQKVQLPCGTQNLKSIIRDQLECRSEYGARSPDDDESIRKWYEQFRETGGVERRHSAGLPRRSDGVRKAFMRSLTKSISRACVKLQMT